MTTRLHWKQFVLVLILFCWNQVRADDFPISPGIMSDDFITVWNSDTTYSGSSINTKIVIPGTGTNYDIFWEEVAVPSNNGSLTGNGATTISFPSPGIYRVYISPGSGTFTRIAFENSGDNHKILDIEQWGTISWTSMEKAFYGCSQLDISATDAPDLSLVTTMYGMFRGCVSLTNPSMNSWDVSGVTIMSTMFYEAAQFNSDIGSWNTGSLQQAILMFFRAYNFNQDIGGWNTANVTHMSGMFESDSTFNQDIGNWNTENVDYFSFMFTDAKMFNQDLSNWDVSSASSMANMFSGASSLDQDFGDWNLHANVKLENMFDNSGMSCAMYDSTLIKWYANPNTPDNRTLGVDNLNYWQGLAARAKLIGNKGWTIDGDSYYDCNYIPPDYEITTTDGNLIITDLSGNGDLLEVTDTGTDITFSLFDRVYSLNGGAYTNFPVDISLVGIDSIEINMEAGNDTIDLNLTSIDLPSLSINGGMGNDEVFFSSDIDFYTDANLDIDLQNDDAMPGVDNVWFVLGADIALFGEGDATIRVSRQVTFDTSAVLTIENGDLTIEANQQVTPATGSLYGIYLNHAQVEITGSGNMDLKGKGGDNGSNQIGIFLDDDSRITGGNGGLSTIEGEGGLSTGNANFGVFVSNQSQITTDGGDLMVTGTGNGVGTSSSNCGVMLDQEAEIGTNGTGTLTVVGTGGNSSGDGNSGVIVNDSYSMISSFNGDIMVTGHGGGSGTSGYNVGIEITDDSDISSLGGNIFLNGTGGLGTGHNSYGVRVGSNTSVYTFDGSLDIEGLGGGEGMSDSNYGIFNEGLIAAYGVGDIHIDATGGPSAGGFNHGYLGDGTYTEIITNGGAVYLEGYGGGSGNASNNTGVKLTNGTDIEVYGTGIITVEGTGGSASGSNNCGVQINNLSTITPHGGDITITGQGGGLNNSGMNFGVILNASAEIVAQGSENIFVHGTGGGTEGSANGGVFINDQSRITTNDGDLDITGIGNGAGASANNFGVKLDQSAELTAQGAGKVTVEGTGGNSTGDGNSGVIVNDSYSMISSFNGDIMVTGHGGGSGTSGYNVGIEITDDSDISSLGGNIFLNGTGGLGTGHNSYGVRVGSNTSVYTFDGNLDIEGLGGGEGMSDSNHGVFNEGLIAAYGVGGIHLDATGGPSAGGFNHGYLGDGGYTEITTNGGAVYLEGYGGGSGNASNNTGVKLTNGTDIEVYGTGIITVEGTGGSASGSNNCGVQINNLSTITPHGGDVMVTGQGGGLNSSGMNFGVVLNAGAEIDAQGFENVFVHGTGGETEGSANGGVFINDQSRITTNDGDLDVTGIGNGAGASANNFGVKLDQSAELTAQGAGKVTVEGTGGNSTGDGNSGVIVNDYYSRISSSNGEIMVTGQGGGSGTSGQNVGIAITDDGDIFSISGNIFLNGTGGLGTGHNSYGVRIGSGSNIYTNDGTLDIEGLGGGEGMSDSNHGVFNEGLIAAYGVGGIHLDATGGPSAGGFNHGYLGDGAYTEIITNGGDVYLEGYGGGTGTAGNNTGVNLSNGTNIEVYGAGKITIEGTGGSASGSNNCGVQVSNLSTITSHGGDISFDGIEGGGDSGMGIRHSGGSDISNETGSGNIRMAANSINIDASVSVNPSDTVFIQPYNAGIGIFLGPAGDSIGGPLHLTDEELDSVSTTILYIGQASSGAIYIDSNITRTALTELHVLTDEDILIRDGFLDAANGDIYMHHGTSPYAVLPLHSGADVKCGALYMDGDLAITIDSTVADTTYSVLSVLGEVDLSGVDLVLDGTYAPQAGETFTIVDNDGADAIIGTFTGLPEGASIPSFLGSSYPATISYIGGTGNDVVITVDSPDYIITNTGSQLTVTDVGGNGETMYISESGGDVLFGVSGRMYSLNGAVLASFPIAVPIAGLDSIEINLEEGADILQSSAFVTAFPNLRINAGTGDDDIQLLGDINFQPSASFDLDLANDDPFPGIDRIIISNGANIILSDTGSLVIKSSQYLSMHASTRLQTEDGDLTIEMNMQVTPTSGSFPGLNLDNAAIEVTGLGQLSIKSRGGTASSSQLGISCFSGATILGGTNGTTQIEGYGGASNNSYNYGVVLQGVGTLLSTNGSDMHIIGTGGGIGAGSSTNYGVHVLSGAIISAGGDGTVYVEGFGGGGEGVFNAGVRLSNSTAMITSSGGDVIVEGTGGSLSTGNWNYGVLLFGDSQITSGGTGSVTVTGTGGASTGSGNAGIVVEQSDAIIGAQGGNTEVFGYGGGSGSSSSNIGVYVRNGGSIANALSGTLIVTGTGGLTTGYSNFGITCQNAGSTTTEDADLMLIGNGGGSGPSKKNYGVFFSNATTTAGGSGNLLIDGTGGLSEGGENFGVYADGASTFMTTAGGDLDVIGQGSGSASASQNHGVIVSSGATIEAGGMGTVTVQGTGGQTAGQFNYGVRAEDSGTSVSSNGGDVTIIGLGGGAAGSGDSNYGVFVMNGALLSVGGSGSLHIDATGGASAGNNNKGLHVFNYGSLTSSNGDILINAQGGGDVSGGSNAGVDITTQGSIIAGGTGSIAITGAGGITSGSSNYGIRIRQSSPLVQTTNGNITLNGTGGGTGSSANGSGVYISADAMITAGGSGQIDINGIGASAGGANNCGVHIFGANGLVTTAGGDIHIHGTEGGGSSGYGFQHYDGAEISSTSGSGNIYLTANSMHIAAPVNLMVSDTVFIQPLTPGVEIKLGPSNNPIGGPLHLTDGELDYINAARMVAGHDACGTITIVKDINRPIATDLRLISAEDILFTTGSIDTEGSNLHLDPGASPFGVYPLEAGQDVFADTLTFGSDLIVSIEGVVPDTEYDQMNLEGVIDLTGVDLILQGSYIPMDEDSFIIVQNDDIDAILGTFVGLAEGDTIFNFLSDTHDAIITYTGNTGNDVVLRVIEQCTNADIPILSATLDTACAGETITLMVDSGDLGDAQDWHWYSTSCGTTPEGVGSSIMVSPSETTTYFVRGEGGCISDGPCAEITVTINPFPDATIDQVADNPCYYTINTFQPVAGEIPGATYAWDFGVTAEPPSATGYGPHDVYYNVSGPKTVKLVIYPNESGAQCPDSSTIDFTIINCPGQILGKVWDDHFEPISSVHVLLYEDADTNGVADNDTPIRSIFTGSGGDIGMSNLTPGHYVLTQNQPSGWSSLDDYDASPDGDVVPNSDSLDNIIPVSILPLEVDSMNVFIEKAIPGEISGAVFEDFNLNEYPDPGEGIADVTLEIFPDQNQDGVADTIIPLYSGMTDAMGEYLFTDIPVGDYVIVETQPAGMVSIQDVDSSNDGDIVPNTDMQDDTIPFTLINMELDADNYFIEAPSCGLMVMNTNDSGVGSLRSAISCAGDGDTIRFHISLEGMTIDITTDLLEVNDTIVILSTLSPRVILSSQTTGMFDVLTDGYLEVSGFDVISGISPGGTGAAFENQGTLKLDNMNVLRNPLLPLGEYLIRNNPGSELILDGDCQIQGN